MPDVDAAYVQKVFHIAKQKREPNSHNDGQAGDFGVVSYKSGMGIFL
jgi:hypothetical protein